MTSPHITLPIIGYVRSPLTQKFGIPRQPNLVAIPSRIELLAPYHNPQAWEGITEFSHIWVMWQFHQNRDLTMPSVSTTPPAFRPQVRPPRLGGNERIGVFATRSMYRPSALGLSVVKLIAVDSDKGKLSLIIEGADMVDGTPVVDVKPYIAYSDSLPTAVSGYANHQPIPKPVKLTPQAQAQQQTLIQKNSLSEYDGEIILALVAQDPRPAYRQTEIDSLFTMRYQQVDVVFSMDEFGQLWIQALQALPAELDK